MLAGIWIVFCKELIYTLRDRKTLAFMILIPTLFIPLLIFGIGRVAARTQKEFAVKAVKIAASAQTQEAYRRLVHGWFLGTEVAQGVRLVTSPIMRALIRREELGALGELHPEVLTDPAAFDAWTRRIVGLVREGLDTPARRKDRPTVELPESVQQQLVAYYRVVIKGLGLIEFVDPSALPPVREDREPPALPENLHSLPQARQIASAIRAGSLHGYLDVPAETQTLAEDSQRALEVTFVHDSTNDLSQEANSRVASVVREINRNLVRTRLQARGLSERFVEPLALKTGTDLATKAERRLARIGGVLPMFVIMFALLGAMYPAVDLGAGEKERFTLETLLLCPLSRTQIALGKSLVILAASLTAALLGLASLVGSAEYLVPGHLRFGFQIDAATLLAVALLTIPPAVSFAGLLLAISIGARSFKEAQNYATGVAYVVLLPPLAAAIPGLEMNWKLALIPLVNVSMLARDLLRGNPHWGYYAACLASCFAVAAICIAYAVTRFRKEEVLFRS